MRIRALEAGDWPRVKEWLGKHPPARSPDLESLEVMEGVLAENPSTTPGQAGEILGLAFFKHMGSGRFEMEGPWAGPEYRDLGLETQLLLSLEITAEKRKARWLQVWVDSDITGQAGSRERSYYLSRGFRFHGFKADFFGSGKPGDRLEKELNTDPLSKPRRRPGQGSDFPPVGLN